MNFSALFLGLAMALGLGGEGAKLGPRDETFELSPTCVITLDGRPCTLADLPAGAECTVSLDADGRVGFLIAVSPKKTAGPRKD